VPPLHWGRKKEQVLERRLEEKRRKQADTLQTCVPPLHWGRKEEQVLETQAASFTMGQEEKYVDMSPRRRAWGRVNFGSMLVLLVSLLCLEQEEGCSR
jgi:hypothetical protein